MYNNYNMLSKLSNRITNDKKALHLHHLIMKTHLQLY